jgi:hypothetical protein
MKIPHGAAGVLHAPAPWTLRGDAWILLLRLPEAVRRDPSHLPAELRARPVHGPSIVMFVDYSESPVGPYRELLYIPGRFNFGAGLRAWSITRILVSTQESVVNGRLNWGIPKERADFRRERAGTRDAIHVEVEGVTAASLEFVPLGPTLPLRAALLPSAIRRLVQHYHGRRFDLVLSARGRAGFGRLRACQTGSALFPDLTSAGRSLALRVPRFTLTFPVPRIQLLPGQD